jgi:hypothetical protein
MKPEHERYVETLHAELLRVLTAPAGRPEPHPAAPDPGPA